MLRNMPLSVLALLLAATGCARHTIPSVVLTPQTRIGPTEDYGPGIVEATSRDVDFKLDMPAYVIAMRVTEARGVELIAPHTGSPRSQRGAHYFRAEPLTSWREGTYSPAFDGPPLSPPCTQPADQRATPFTAGCVDSPDYAPQVTRNITQLRYNSPPSQVGYWLLIVSDAPTRARDLLRQVKQLDLPNASLADRVHSIPEAMIASRTTRWAAYYAAFGTPSK
jgi:hypothetical protein